MEIERPEYLRIPVAARLCSHYAAGSRTDLLALVQELGQAIPGLIQVEKRGGFLGQGARVTAVQIDLQNAVFRLSIPQQEHMPPQAERRRVVHGIVLATEALALPVWLEELGAALEALASSNQNAASALEKWLG